MNIKKNSRKADEIIYFVGLYYFYYYFLKKRMNIKNNSTKADETYYFVAYYRKGRRLIGWFCNERGVEMSLPARLSYKPLIKKSKFVKFKKSVSACLAQVLFWRNETVQIKEKF